MEQLFNFNLEKINNLSEENFLDRKKFLKLFLETGLPNKKDESWKFTDLNQIIRKNFKTITNNQNYISEKKIELIDDFEHNHIFLVNGFFKSSDMKFEETGKVKITSLDSIKDFENKFDNNLFSLNKALSIGGFYLEVQKNYKFEKPLIIYNYFTSNLENKIINNSNKIKLNENSELTIIEYNIGEKNKFLKNTFEEINLKEGSLLKNIAFQKNKFNGYFYKNINGSIEYNSSYESYILSSGLKFNKFDINIDLNGENSNCFILSGLFLDEGEHQEIRTKINHLVPNCKSFQKIKNVLENNSKGVYQGKIYVKDIAQKTNAYQLSKALILNDDAEFNAKPELEIYADDVKCSHGSTSGSIDEEAIHYLMTRGIEFSKAKKLLIKGFLNEIFENIREPKIKKFLEKNTEIQVDGIQ